MQASEEKLCLATFSCMADRQLWLCSAHGYYLCAAVRTNKGGTDRQVWMVKLRIAQLPG